MTAVIANTTFSDGVLSMAKGDIRTIADALASKYIAAGLVTAYTGKVTPSGTLEITVNGIADVYEYANVDVDVPNPSTGTLEITDNGTYDVTDYASAEVAVDAPTETLEITENGTYDVTDYASADVEVAGGGDAIFRGLLFAESITTAEISGEYYGEWQGDFSEFVLMSAMDVVFGDDTYSNIPVRYVDGYYEIGAPEVEGSRDFSTYPFCLRFISGLVDGDLVTQAAGTYAVKAYNKAIYTSATVSVTNNLDSNTILNDLNGGFKVSLLAGETQEVSMILENGHMEFSVYASDVAVAVTGDITWDDNDSYGVISGDGTITITADK